ncbi:MAG: adenylate kinase [Thermoproteota archaeon]|jgi:adenylate kinase|nr:adenylate kinase [Thermoproteota archaeon]
MKAVIVAVPGAGKTTILNYIRKKMPELKVVNYGDVMLELARERYGIKDRDEMRKKIPLDEYRTLQLDAAKKIADIEGDVLIDTHVSIKMQGGYYPGLPLEAAKALNPDAIILLEYNPSDIIERRKKDMQGIRMGREIESEEEIELHQTINRIFAASVANAVQCLLIIMNLRFKQSREFEHTEIAVERIAEFFMKQKNLKNNI